MSHALPDPIYVRDLDGGDDSRQAHARRARSGGEVRLARGAYLPVAPWLDLDARERYLVRIRAVAQTRRHDMVLSHHSAAAIHGLPIVGPWPGTVHVSIGLVSGGRSRRGVTKHALVVPADQVVEIDGLLVTSIARTVIDLAASGDQRTAIMVADRAILVDALGKVRPLSSKEELWNAYFAKGNFRGAARARRILNFAEDGAESALESLSRLNMRIIRCPSPELQKEFRDHRGFIGRGDFYWNQFRMVGEADGDAKYLDPALRGNRSAEQVLLDEKHREDRIRALGEGVTRWPWSVGVNPQALRAHLRRAGIPIP